MQNLLDWIGKNIEWLLSGVAVSIPVAIFGWWLQRRSPQGQQSATAEGRSVVIQAGGNVVVGADEAHRSERSDRIREIASLREKLHTSGLKWDKHMSEVEALQAKEDFDKAHEDLMQAAATMNELITAYRLNKHLFSAIDRDSIDAELHAAETASGDGMPHLIRAVQRIHKAAEKAAEDLLGDA